MNGVLFYNAENRLTLLSIRKLLAHYRRVVAEICMSNVALWERCVRSGDTIGAHGAWRAERLAFANAARGIETHSLKIA